MRTCFPFHPTADDELGRSGTADIHVDMRHTGILSEKIVRKITQVRILIRQRGRRRLMQP